MKMGKWKNIYLILACLLLGFTTANAGVSFSVGLGSDDYYQPVGDYDYLPYAYQTNPGYAPPRINFYDMMSQYGIWVSVAPFGQVWKPYASNDWRPYTYGHWISTQQYGQVWEGYEPWAWAGYHYGNWIYTRNYGWVWIPGYDWHAGRVTWARSYDSIGWMPSPPDGYDYSRGYLSNVGPNNQFGYNDNDFSTEFDTGNFSYGGPYYDSRYRNMYYNPSYTNMNSNLWVFIDNASYGYDNYANYSLGPEYTRHIFDRRLVRITNRQINRTTLEKLVRQRIREIPVDVRELQIENRRIKIVVPRDSDAIDKVRKNSKEVVREIIAPGFAEKQKPFKGQNSRNREIVAKIFRQEKVEPKVETLTSEQIINEARKAKQDREQSRTLRAKAEKEKLQRIEKEGRIHEPEQKGNNEEPKLKDNAEQDTKGKDLKKESDKDSQLKSKAKKSKAKDKDKDKDKQQQQEQPRTRGMI